jgi:hypothetical protein
MPSRAERSGSVRGRLVGTLFPPGKYSVPAGDPFHYERKDPWQTDRGRPTARWSKLDRRSTFFDGGGKLDHRAEKGDRTETRIRPVQNLSTGTGSDSFTRKLTR